MARRKLLDQVSDIARFRHLSLRTEETYRNWIKRFILFHGKRHPRKLDAEAVPRFSHSSGRQRTRFRRSSKSGVQCSPFSL